MSERDIPEAGEGQRIEGVTELIGSAARPLPKAARSVVAPIVEGLGYEIVGVELAREGARLVLWVYIDGPEGVGIDDCAKVSREASAALDVEDPIPQAYELRVSSPGLDRPLMIVEHFEEQIDEIGVIQLGEPLDGRRKFTGTIKAVHRGSVVGDTLTGSSVDVEVDGEIFNLPIADIHKARLKYTFDEPTPKGRKK